MNNKPFTTEEMLQINSNVGARLPTTCLQRLASSESYVHDLAFETILSAIERCIRQEINLERRADMKSRNLLKHKITKSLLTSFIEAQEMSQKFTTVKTQKFHIKVTSAKTENAKRTGTTWPRSESSLKGKEAKGIVVNHNAYSKNCDIIHSASNGSKVVRSVMYRRRSITTIPSRNASTSTQECISSKHTRNSDLASISQFYENELRAVHANLLANVSLSTTDNEDLAKVANLWVIFYSRLRITLGERASTITFEQLFPRFQIVISSEEVDAWTSSHGSSVPFKLQQSGQKSFVKAKSEILANAQKLKMDAARDASNLKAQPLGDRQVGTGDNGGSADGGYGWQTRDWFRSSIGCFAAACGVGYIASMAMDHETLKADREAELQKIKAALDGFEAELRSVLAQAHAADEGRALADGKPADSGSGGGGPKPGLLWASAVLMQLWDFFCCRIMQRLGDEFGDVAFDFLYLHFRALVIQHVLNQLDLKGASDQP